MRRYQPSLCPWSHSAALHLGLNSWLSSSLPVRQPSPTAGSEESGRRNPWFGSFWPKALAQVPPSLSHHIPTALPARQEPPASPASSLQGMKALGVKQRWARTETKMQLPRRGIVLQSMWRARGEVCDPSNTLQPDQSCIHTQHNLDSCQHRQGEPGPEEGWHGSSGWGPAPGTGREPSKQLLTAEAPGRSRISPWQPPSERGPVPPAHLCAKQEGDQDG